ncbi:hypothetical protein RND81_10G182200 [Saponaria officinalis]|uniref:RRM domain-containing protein n=1 Tax=Saponaria officinalis TaxID=3572 RepID=A0AAW1I624_SAPOF
MRMSNKSENGQFGDTTLTKVFVGGLAWETPKEALHDHFVNFGDIVEAVIITDKISGRSKGYGFVTFKEPQAAKKACEDATPIINGRRANCNLAALGARRPSRSSPATPPLPTHQHQTASNGGGPGGNSIRGPTSGATPAAHAVQWYYPATTGPHAATASFHAHHQHQAVPFYPGYSPAAYITAHDHVGYNHKVSYNSGGAYMNGQYAQMYQGGGGGGGGQAMMAIYPYYPYAQAQQQAHHPAMGLPAHFLPHGPFTTSPPIISKPTTPVCITPPKVCLAVE